MAFKPSLRRSQDSAEAEPDMLPVMALMCILIPVLLSSTQSIRLGMIELSLPGAARPANTGPVEPREKEKRLDLSVTITRDGFVVGSALGVGMAGYRSSVTGYDFKALTGLLTDIKRKGKGSFADMNKIAITAEEGIPYHLVVHTMDAARTYEDRNGMKRPLFPDVAVAAGIR